MQMGVSVKMGVKVLVGTGVEVQGVPLGFRQGVPKGVGVGVGLPGKVGEEDLLGHPIKAMQDKIRLPKIKNAKRFMVGSQRKVKTG